VVGIPARRLVLSVALLAALGAGPGRFVPARATAGVPGTIGVIAIDGRGFGHGVGLPQDGALAMARARASTDQILGRFYPGTRWGKAGGAVRVGVAEAKAATGRFVVTFPGGGEIRDSRDASHGAGLPLRVGKGGAIAISFDGAHYEADVLATGHALAPSWRLAAYVPIGPLDTTSTTTPAPTTTRPSPTTTEPTTATTRSSTTAVSSDPLWAVPNNGGDTVVPIRNREYRGVVEALAAAGGFRLVNEVDVEDYLRGMGEVRDPSWPAPGLEAQAVAARTYALRAAHAGTRPEGFHLFDDDRSQVYIGRTAEYAAMDKAVAHTKGKVLTFNGALAATVYSSSAGGITASAPEGFGSAAPDRPYLAVTKYDTADPHAWHLDVDPAALATRVGYNGAPRVVAVSRRGPSGRAVEVTIEGTAGAFSLDGTTFAAQLGLRSTLFDLGFAQSTVAPPPLPAPTVLQQLPEGGPVVEATTATPAPVDLPWHGVPSRVAFRRASTTVGPQRGPLPNGIALTLLLFVTWGLISRTSTAVARTNVVVGDAARVAWRRGVRRLRTRPRRFGV